MLIMTSSSAILLKSLIGDVPASAIIVLFVMSPFTDCFLHEEDLLRDLKPEILVAMSTFFTVESC